jgi:nitrogen fixation-related uncharacterized protein
MTLTSFPGAFFLVSAAITVPVLLIFAWFYWQVRKEQNEEMKIENDIIDAEEGGSDSSSDEQGSDSPHRHPDRLERF